MTAALRKERRDAPAGSKVGRRGLRNGHPRWYRTRPVRPYGASSLGTLFAVAVVALAGWWLIVIGPAYLDHFDVKMAVTEAVARAPRNSDETLAGYIIQKTGTVGEHEADDGYGNVTTKKGLGLTRDDITITRDEVNNSISIRVEYARVRKLKPLSGERTLHFVAEDEGVLRE